MRHSSHGGQPNDRKETEGYRVPNAHMPLSLKRPNETDRKHDASTTGVENCGVHNHDTVLSFNTSDQHMV